MRGPAAPPLTVTAADRLVTTAFFAALFHGIVLLGVSFAPSDPGGAASPTLEVTVVQQRSDDEAPEEAEDLAQADQMLAAAQRAERLIQVGTNMRHMGAAAVLWTLS